MPSWNAVLAELSKVASSGPLDIVRRKYLASMHKLTSRNVIAYYSGFLDHQNSRGIEISDLDMNSFMNVVHKLDCSKGLDLVLHTPGGGISATEAIVAYLRSKFGCDIRCFVPQLAMSAGTMIACACREIHMGKHSSIGPIDPQFSGIPAYGVLEEVEQAIDAIRKDPASIPVWQTILGKYHPTFVGECSKAIELSSHLVSSWLAQCMLEGDPCRKINADKIVKQLNNHSDTMQHDRHISIDKARDIGLRVVPLEQDSKLQDVVLTVHHAYIHTFASSKAVKIVENHLGIASVLSV